MENFIYDRIREHYVALHQIPEIGEELYKTKEYIMSVLGSMSCEITVLLTTGMCVYFSKGKRETLAFRSDMDGLMISENPAHELKSLHPEHMHACGHDAHMSMLLGFAEYVNSTADLPHNILLIFQPAEETTGGAKRISESGIFEGYNVIATYGLHMWPELPAGHLASKSGALMPKSSELSIEVEGRSTHAATSHKGVDALKIASEYIESIYAMHESLLSKCTSKDEYTLLKICKFQSGTARNVIAGRASLLGTMRAFSLSDFDSLEDKLKNIAEEFMMKYDCTITVNCTEGYLPVINHPDLYKKITPVLNELKNYTQLLEPVMISEDFSYYGTKAPSIFTLLGTGGTSPLHSSDFSINLSSLSAGYDYFVKLANTRIPHASS